MVVSSNNFINSSNMSNNSSDNKRIAKNTLLLYARQLLVMAITLYTSRIVLETLGVSDFGIYNVVGGIVTMFTFIRSAMGNATNRYITFALGKGEEKELKKIFSSCIYVHTILALLIIVLAETVGVWLLYSQLDIPAERMTAAFWVLQFSVFTCAISVLCVPYDAELIAHEKMGVFAALSILDIVLKLIIVIFIQYTSYDRLIMYAFLLMCIQLFDRIIYNIYCKRAFIETRERVKHDKALVKEMFGFAGWNLIGNMATIGCTPVLNIFLNIFFGPAVNAARGIAVQVQGAVQMFIANFQLAVIPQITKNYAVGNLNRMNNLVISCSKLSFFLFLCIALPICLEAETILALWLVEVPEHTANFLRLVLFVMLVESMQQPLHSANLATGRIRKFQTIKGLSLMTMLPIAYVALKFGAPSEIVFIVQFLVTMVSLIIQLLIIGPLIGLSIKKYSIEVFVRTLGVLCFSAIIPVALKLNLREGFFSFMLICCISILSVLVFVFLLGINKSEREFVNNEIKNMLHK